MSAFDSLEKLLETLEVNQNIEAEQARRDEIARKTSIAMERANREWR